MKSATAALGAGVDVKSHRGLAFCPPTPGYLLLERRRIAQAPDWLIRRCGPADRSRRRRGESLPFEDPRVRRAVEHAVERLRRTGKLVLQGGCMENQMALFQENQGDDNARHHE